MIFGIRESVCRGVVCLFFIVILVVIILELGGVFICCGGGGVRFFFFDLIGGFVVGIFFIEFRAGVDFICIEGLFRFLTLNLLDEVGIVFCLFIAIFAVDVIYMDLGRFIFFVFCRMVGGFFFFFLELEDDRDFFA